MIIDALKNILAMGGYAIYVWPAYGLFLLILTIDYLVSALAQRRLLRQFAQQTNAQHHHTSP